MLFEEKIPISYRSAFTAKVQSIANTIGIEADWLMAVMNKETGGTFSPSVKNPTSSATGLIQFMADTATGLGTSTSALRSMTAEDQLDYVQKYFLPYKNKLKSYADTYLAVFYPAALGQSDTWVFPNWVYNANKGMDVNKNGSITLGEFKTWINNSITFSTEVKKKIT